MHRHRFQVTAHWVWVVGLVVSLVSVTVCAPVQSALAAPSTLTQLTQPTALLGPTNALANASNVWTLKVAQMGMQRMPFSVLQPSPGALSTANWHVRYNGQDLAIKLDDANTNNIFDAGDVLWFYAPFVGDRFNATTRYWLSHESTPGARMAVSLRQTTDPATTSVALERGRWQPRKLYTSLHASEDGDHFYAGQVQASYPVPILSSPISVKVGGVLPPISSSVAISIAAFGTTSAFHNGLFSLGGVSRTVTWTGAVIAPVAVANFVLAGTGVFTLATFETNPSPLAFIDAILLASVGWERRVSLDFGNGAAHFFGLGDATHVYQLNNVPLDAALYDVSNPLAPVVVGQGGSNSSWRFRDEPGRAYVLVNPAQPLLPEVTAHAPVDLAPALNKDALYIVPNALQANLAPLLAHRATQGYQPISVAVESIYDAWSFGQVSPKAIRDFLRYAAASWQIKPIAVTLVGDGTYDPQNFLGIIPAPVNLIPPYLAPVDPFIGETACDNCYAQLDGDDPLLPPDNDTRPDVMIGRLPVKSALELDGLVNKIIGYETAPVASGPSGWRTRMGFVADNYQFEDGRTDGAGDFVAFSEASVARQPIGIDIDRAYFDPCKPHSVDISHLPCALAATALPRAEDIATAQERVRELFADGQAVLTYNGHGNLLKLADENLFDVASAQTLTNAVALPMVLQMACLTGQFSNPDYSEGLDEALLLRPNGGAIAVWGSAGWGVAHGHDALQRGFFNELWRSSSWLNPMRTPIGQLVRAGYTELLFFGGCCQDSIQTFHLLGDPLTPLRVSSPSTLFGVARGRSGPLPGALVTAVGGGSTYSATTNSQGEYVMGLPISGTVQVSATLDGYMFTPISHTVVVSPLGAQQDFTSTTQSIVELGAATFSARELDANATVTVTRHDAPLDPITVTLTLVGNSALPGTDFVSTTIPITFAPGDLQKTALLALVNDAKGEPTEGFTVSLSSPQNAALGIQAQAAVTIVDDDKWLTYLPILRK